MARQDFDVLEAAEGDDLEIVGAVVMSRDADGKVDVREFGDEDVAGGAWIGGGVGLFAPPLLVSTAIGAGIGAVLGHFVKKHEEREIGVSLDDFLPCGSSAVAVVVDDKYLDRVEAALTRSEKKTSKVIDGADYDQRRAALADAEQDDADAVDS